LVSKPQIRFKGKAQADPPSPSDERRAMAGQVEKAQSRQRRDEQVHLPEACNAVPLQAGALDGVLKPILNKKEMLNDH
jgi:hypothetical protein